MTLDDWIADQRHFNFNKGTHSTKKMRHKVSPGKGLTTEQNKAIPYSFLCPTEECSTAWDGVSPQFAIPKLSSSFRIAHKVISISTSGP